MFELLTEQVGREAPGAAGGRVARLSLRREAAGAAAGDELPELDSSRKESA